MTDPNKQTPKGFKRAAPPPPLRRDPSPMRSMQSPLPGRFQPVSPHPIHRQSPTPWATLQPSTNVIPQTPFSPPTTPQMPQTPQMNAARAFSPSPQMARAFSPAVQMNVNRHLSPAPQSNIRQKSPTPTFNARQHAGTPPAPAFQLRHHAGTPTGMNTIYDSRQNQTVSTQQNLVHLPGATFKPVQPAGQHPHPMSPLTATDMSYPRPFRSTFSPPPSSTSSIPPFSPPPPAQLKPSFDVEYHVAPKSNEFYVVPLEPSTLTRNVNIYDQEDNRPSTADIIAQQSQDYIDEKLAEYQGVISLLQGKIIAF